MTFFIVKLVRTLQRRNHLFRPVSLPKPQNRQGFELRCQVISPIDPL